ncbi:hypothetical protein [Streptomyces europaeiscabiei]|uniref:hypothetical protein n=1 Tax=Streptomyces europaeiscabiei TaxID=146819 RepID=UPI002E2B9EA9|nr:hypothetical protein [Streptomyces europaeiscabiei]
MPVACLLGHQGRLARVVETDLVGDPIGVDQILAREHEPVGRPRWRAGATISGTRNRTPPMPVGRGVLVRSEQVLGVTIEELDLRGAGRRHP